MAGITNMGEPVSRFMGRVVQSIGEAVTLTKAEELMRASGVQCLPVQYAGKLIGVLSARDIRFALAMQSDARNLKVGEILIDSPYIVSPHAPMEEVLSTMAQEGHACALIRNERGSVNGIFTLTDAVRFLEDIVRKSPEVDGGPMIQAAEETADGRPSLRKLA